MSATGLFRIAVARQHTALVWAECPVLETGAGRQATFDPFPAGPGFHRGLIHPHAPAHDEAQLNARAEGRIARGRQREGFVATPEVPYAHLAVLGGRKESSGIGPVDRRRHGTSMR